MSKSCKGLAMELVKCLSETDCVKVEKQLFRECAGEKPPFCLALLWAIWLERNNCIFQNKKAKPQQVIQSSQRTMRSRSDAASHT